MAYDNHMQYLNMRGMLSQGGIHMIRKNQRKDKRSSNSGHRPMIPEFHRPGDLLDAVIREPRRRYDDINPDQNIKWR